MDLTDDKITVETELNSYQFLAITMKKLSTGKILTSLYKSYNTQFTFENLMNLIPNSYLFIMMKQTIY